MTPTVIEPRTTSIHRAMKQFFNQVLRSQGPETIASVPVFANETYTPKKSKPCLPRMLKLTHRRTPYRWSFSLNALGLHENGKVNKSVGVAPLVVVPADKLVEGVAEVNAGLGIDDGGAGIVDEILAYDGKVGVAQDALKFGTLRRGLEGGIDLLTGAGLDGADGEIDHGDVGGGDADGHTRELAVEGGKDLADGLGGTGRGGDHVGDGRTSAAPVLL